jgi:hypothetical protein
VPVADRARHIRHAGTAVQRDQLDAGLVAVPNRAQQHDPLRRVLDQVRRRFGDHDRQVVDPPLGHGEFGGQSLRGAPDTGGGSGLFHAEPSSTVEEPFGK